MTNNSFCPVVPFGLIQGIRLAHALMESRFEVCIPPEHADKLDKLRTVFGARYRVATEGVPMLEAFALSHSKPSTSVGALQRPLIFPHAIPAACRGMWPEEREMHVSFVGLMTAKRESLIAEWCRRNNGPAAQALPTLEPAWLRAANMVRKRLGGSPMSHMVRVGCLSVSSSARGRTPTMKAWDGQYFRQMAHSRFVLCPSGDYVWSYRFFESMLCGAIPVVEETCDAYAGFEFRRMSDPLEALVWDADAAEYNYRRCVEHITIPLAAMNEELESLLGRP